MCIRFRSRHIYLIFCTGSVAYFLWQLLFFTFKFIHFAIHFDFGGSTAVFNQRKHRRKNFLRTQSGWFTAWPKVWPMNHPKNQSGRKITEAAQFSRRAIKRLCPCGKNRKKKEGKLESCRYKVYHRCRRIIYSHLHRSLYLYQPLPRSIDLCVSLCRATPIRLPWPLRKPGSRSIVVHLRR